MTREWRRFEDGLWALATLAALLLAGLGAGWLRAAPAPLPRREAARPPVPGECLLHWNHCRYRAKFWPSGEYHARGLGGLSDWEGTWARDGDGVLIHERPVGGLFWLDWRAAFGGSGPLRLEPWRGE